MKDYLKNVKVNLFPLFVGPKKEQIIRLVSVDFSRDKFLNEKDVYQVSRNVVFSGLAQRLFSLTDNAERKLDND